MSKGRRRDKPRQPTPQPSNPLTANPRQVAQQQVSAWAASFSGPLPLPEILVKYNDAVPDGAERVIAMAERQAEHRMALENRVIDADIKRANWGLAAGFVVAIVGLIVSYLLVDGGNTAPGVAVAAIDLVGLVAVFVVGTVSRRGERQERVKMMSGKL